MHENETTSGDAKSLWFIAPAMETAAEGLEVSSNRGSDVALAQRSAEVQALTVTQYSPSGRLLSS